MKGKRKFVLVADDPAAARLSKEILAQAPGIPVEIRLALNLFALNHCLVPPGRRGPVDKPLTCLKKACCHLYLAEFTCYNQAVNRRSNKGIRAVRRQESWAPGSSQTGDMRQF